MNYKFFLFSAKIDLEHHKSNLHIVPKRFYEVVTYQICRIRLLPSSFYQFFLDVHQKLDPNRFAINSRIQNAFTKFDLSLLYLSKDFTFDFLRSKFTTLFVSYSRSRPIFTHKTSTYIHKPKAERHPHNYPDINPINRSHSSFINPYTYYNNKSSHLLLWWQNSF